MKGSKDIFPVRLGKLLLRGARIFDPVINLDKLADILIINGKIEKIENIQTSGFDGEVLECKGKVIIPGLIDMHTHLREPGREDEETIATGSQAAMAGGFTAVCCMPNTNPVIDNSGQIKFIKEKSEGLLVDVYPIAAVTKGQEGKELTEMGDIINAGGVAFSDDGYPVKNTAILRRALEYVKMFGKPIIDHCEDLSLSGNGVMNEGFVAEYTKGPLHIAHVSTKGSVALIREAKAKGVNVTAEVCPHHLFLTDEAVRTFDTNTKMKPPLRTEEDRKALIDGLKDGTIDVIATDHAPHSIEEKETEYDVAPFGVIGLETALGLVLTHLVGKGLLTLKEIVEKMSVSPRKILGLAENRIEKGKPANLTILDIEEEWVVDKTSFRSKSHNTPFDGWTLKGKSFGVFNNGQLFLSSSPSTT